MCPKTIIDLKQTPFAISVNLPETQLPVEKSGGPFSAESDKRGLCFRRVCV